jgi:hypothetical protein
MLALKQIDPPAQFRPGGIGELVVGVRILIPSHQLNQYNYPDGNRAGTELLCRLLQARIELAGVRVTEPLGALVFNRSFYLLTVSELEPALKAIKEELEKLGILSWVQIGWYDPREQVFRVWCSKSGRFDVPSDAETGAEKNVVDALLDLAKEINQSEDEPSGQ